MFKWLFQGWKVVTSIWGIKRSLGRSWDRFLDWTGVSKNVQKDELRCWKSRLIYAYTSYTCKGALPCFPGNCIFWTSCSNGKESQDARLKVGKPCPDRKGYARWMLSPPFRLWDAPKPRWHHERFLGFGVSPSPNSSFVMIASWAEGLDSDPNESNTDEVFWGWKSRIVHS